MFGSSAVAVCHNRGISVYKQCWSDMRHAASPRAAAELESLRSGRAFRDVTDTAFFVGYVLLLVVTTLEESEETSTNNRVA